MSSPVNADQLHDQFVEPLHGADYEPFFSSLLPVLVLQCL